MSDRIHGHISNNTIYALQKEVYKYRQAQLKEWAHFTVHPEVHEQFQNQLIKYIFSFGKYYVYITL